MFVKQIAAGGEVPRSWMLVLAPGEEAKEQLLGFVASEQLPSASFFGVGALERGVVAYFDWRRQLYIHIPIDEQVEVLSLIGSVVPDERGSYVLHAHIALGLHEGYVRGGHLIEAHVRPTLELTLFETPADLVRRNSGVGLGTIDQKRAGDHSRGVP